VKVLLDLVEYEGGLAGARSVRDLVGVLQESLNDQRIIAHISLDARPLKPDDWELELVTLPNAILELTTSDRREYIRERVASAEHYTIQIGEELNRVQNALVDGDQELGQNVLAAALASLSSFAEWYVSLLNLDAEKLQPALSTFEPIATELGELSTEIAKLLEVDGWSELNTVIEKKLRPCVSDLTSLCEEAANSL